VGGGGQSGSSPRYRPTAAPRTVVLGSGLLGYLEEPGTYD
jgi:hypothetical protein